jgi:hypothetical protein
LQGLDVTALFFGDGDVERQEPGGRGVDRHRRVHLFDGDVLEELRHVADVGDGNADLADLAARHDVVGIVAGLRGQIEGDGEAGLALRQVGFIKFVGGLGGGVSGVGPHEPGSFA